MQPVEALDVSGKEKCVKCEHDVSGGGTGTLTMVWFRVPFYSGRYVYVNYTQEKLSYGYFKSIFSTTGRYEYTGCSFFAIFTFVSGRYAYTANSGMVLFLLLTFPIHHLYKSA